MTSDFLPSKDSCVYVLPGQYDYEHWIETTANVNRYTQIKKNTNPTWWYVFHKTYKTDETNAMNTKGNHFCTCHIKIVNTAD